MREKPGISKVENVVRYTTGRSTMMFSPNVLGIAYSWPRKNPKLGAGFMFKNDSSIDLSGYGKTLSWVFFRNRYLDIKEISNLRWSAEMRVVGWFPILGF